MNLTNTIKLAALTALVTASLHALAAPGAHGPDGQHLDGPATQSSGADAVPRIETQSEMFELVGRLSGGELSMLINRFETSEPVNNARVELELGQMKAVAQFHADLGDYAVDDAQFLQALSAPGSHALVITVTAGNEADLLDATLTVAPGGSAPGDDHGHGHHPVRETALWGGAGLAGLALLGWAVARRRKAHNKELAGSQ